MAKLARAEARAHQSAQALLDTTSCKGFRDVTITTEIAIADLQEARELRGDVPRPTLQAQHDLDDQGGVIHDGRHDHLPTGYQFELIANTTED